MITTLLINLKKVISKISTSYTGLAIIFIALVYTAINTGN